MTAYPLLPEFEGRQAEEPAVTFGARALTFLVQHGVTATLDDDALEQAEHAAIYVVASRDISVIALEKLSAIRHVIAATLRHRARTPVTPAVPAGRPPSAPEGGRAARLTPPMPRRPSPSSVVSPF